MARTKVVIEMDEDHDGMSMIRRSVHMYVHDGTQWKLAYEDTFSGRKQAHERRCWEDAIPMVVADAAKRLDSVDLGTYCDEALGIERDDE